MHCSVAIDSPLTYGIGIYTTAGLLVTTIEAYSNALGVRSLMFHRPPLVTRAPSSSSSSSTYPLGLELGLGLGLEPSSGDEGDTLRARSAAGAEAHFTYPLPPLQQLFAVGSYDNNVRLITMGSWKVAFVLPLALHSDMPPGLCPTGFQASVEVAFDDTGRTGGNTYNKGAQNKKSHCSAFSKRDLRALPRRIPVAASKGTPQTGVSDVGWSGDGSLLAARSDTHPQVFVHP